MIHCDARFNGFCAKCQSCSNVVISSVSQFAFSYSPFEKIRTDFFKMQAMKLLLAGKLHEYLYEINEECYEMLDTLIRADKEIESVTEQLKAENQMRLSATGIGL